MSVRQTRALAREVTERRAEPAAIAPSSTVTESAV